MAGFIDKLVGGVKKLLQNDTLWSAAVSWFDPEIRRWAEECALVIREQATARGIILSEEDQRRLAERVLAALRGVFERMANNHVQNKPMVVILEKVFNDIPDFMATVLFSDEREFQMWLRLRAERGLALSAKRNVPVGDIATGEREFNTFYAEVRRTVEEILGKSVVIPEGLIEQNAGRLEQALQEKFVPKEKTFEPMSAAAGRLKAKIGASFDKLTKFLESITHMDFDDEQRAIIEAKEEELHRLQRRRHFDKSLENLDQRIAEEHQKLGE
jgi:hypothetical protein